MAAILVNSLTDHSVRHSGHRLSNSEKRNVRRGSANDWRESALSVKSRTS